MTSRRFAVVERAADAATLHAFEPPGEATPTMVVADVTAPALVLGSTQPDTDVDAARADAAGFEVVRRRSGGGSVWLAPGAQVWVDVWIPAGDRLWTDDVVAAAVPVGEAWAAVLAGLDLGAGLTVHRGGLVATEWSGRVCFAGIGPGEVIDGTGAKWVGLSQRRTRSWIRLQTMVHRRWSAAAAVEGLDLDAADRGRAVRELAPAVGVIGEADPIPALIASLG